MLTELEQELRKYFVPHLVSTGLTGLLPIGNMVARLTGGAEVPEYICLYCYHRWNSNGSGRVMRCSNCHRRQGISYDKFCKAVDVAKRVLQKIAASPPPHRPPLEAISDVLAGLDPVLDVARKEFPSPLVPVTLFREILTEAITQVRKERRRKAVAENQYFQQLTA